MARSIDLFMISIPFWTARAINKSARGIPMICTWVIVMAHNQDRGERQRA